MTAVMAEGATAGAGTNTSMHLGLDQWETVYDALGLKSEFLVAVANGGPSFRFSEQVPRWTVPVLGLLRDEMVIGAFEARGMRVGGVIDEVTAPNVHHDRNNNLSYVVSFRKGKRPDPDIAGYPVTSLVGKRGLCLCTAREYLLLLLALRIHYPDFRMNDRYATICGGSRLRRVVGRTGVETVVAALIECPPVGDAINIAWGPAQWLGGRRIDMAMGPREVYLV